jgi:molybdate transport system ATP-binding protein
MSLEIALRCSGESEFQLDLACSIPDQGVTALCGASGSGKSTLLDCIAGLRKPNLGSRIYFRDQKWLTPRHCSPAWQRRIGYVFQDARLFPHLTVAGNFDFASRRAQGEIPLSRTQLIEILGLADLLDQKPDTLSAGQKQRAAIGRALCSAPQLLLLDEPLANLDHQASAECLALLQALAQELDLPMLYVSHDIEEVSQIADHLLLLEEGKLQEQGLLMTLSSRLDTRLAHEEQAAAILLATISAQDDAFALTQMALEGQTLQVNRLPLPVGTRRRLRIPARDVSICLDQPTQTSILNVLPVTIAEIEPPRGARLLLRLALGEQYLLARITRKSAERLGLKAGDKVFAQIKSVALLSEAGDAT